MNFNSYRGILNTVQLTADRYNRDWFTLEQLWNNQDSGIIPFSNISFGMSSKTASSAYTLLPSDQVIFADTTSAFTITLPNAVSVPGKFYVIKITTGTKTLTINTTNSQTIDGNTSIFIPGQYFSVQLMSNGSNWFVL